MNMHVDQTKILSMAEIRAVLADLKRRGRRSANSRQNLIVFRLSACSGLRVSELIGLRIGDVRVGHARPYVYVRKEIAKRHKTRRVPLWWDQGTLDDLTAWRDERAAQGTGTGDPFLCSQARGASGRPLDRFNARQRFRVACRVLGPERVADLTIHDGRHTAISHWLAGGRSLPEVRDASGHANISTTSIYLHATPDDGTVGNIFGTG